MNTKDLICPSGLKVTIREATGADEDVFSGASAKDYEIINQYLAGLIVNSDMGKMTSEKVEKLFLGDKYFILIESRIFSLGKILYFSHKWTPESEPLEYEVDLTQYVWDYTKPFPQPGDPEFFDQRIRPYAELVDGYYNLTVGDKDYRFRPLDGVGEKYLLELPEKNRTINKQLIARDLQYFDGSKWVKVVNFSALSVRELALIRAKVKELDPEILGIVYLENPYMGTTQEIPLLAIPDFFFPTKI